MTRSRGRFGAFALYLADAVVFLFAFYKTTEAVLFWHEAGGSAARPAAIGLASLLTVAALARVRRSLPPATSAVRAASADGLLLVILGVALPSILIHLPPTLHEGTKSSISFLWMPIEWHKYPYNIRLIARTYPLVVYMVTGIALLIAWIAVATAHRKWAAFLCVAIALAIGSRLGEDQMGFRSPFFRLVFCGPWIFAAVAAWRSRPCALCRTLVVAGSLVVLSAFYTGAVPWKRIDPADLPLRAEILYPPPDEPSAFPLQYLRKIWVDPRRESLFASYGPTSGLIRLNLRTHALDLLETEGLIRHFWSEPRLPDLLAIEWIYDDLWIVNKDTFEIEAKQHLMDGTLIAPIDILATPDDVFIVSTEFPALTQFDRATLRRIDQIDFRAAGLTPFRSGAWIAAHNPATGRIYVQVGMVDLDDRFVLAEVAPHPLRIVRVLDLPAGGLEMVHVPGKNALLLPDFYSDRIYEIGLEPFVIRRAFPAVVNARSLAYDPGRDVIYAASFMNGRFAALRYADGRPLYKLWIGKKPSSIFFSETEDALYVGSSEGLFRFDPAAFLREDPGSSLDNAQDEGADPESGQGSFRDKPAEPRTDGPPGPPGESTGP